MTIPTQMSLNGFIASTPQLTFTGNGVARFYARIGVEHFRKEAHASYTKLEPTFHDMVLFRATAERSYARFRAGDSFVASGYINEYELERSGHTEAREEFVARHIGHDTARTRYDVDRSPGRQSDPPSDQIPVPHEPSPAVGI